ncbi:hypothetical protein KR054_003136, partial [Drosophila jambulina]
MEEPRIPPDDQAIVITQFFNPQQFSYVRLRDVMASASLVFQMEQTLVKHCTKEKNERRYLVDQKVIVLYKPRSPPKLLRGVVKKCENDEYLVWISDYGFTLYCSSLDLWPLPEDLTPSFWEVKDGGIAYIKPKDNSWTKSCLREFDNLLQEAVQLNFEVVGQGKPNRNFGKLMFKDVASKEVFQDAAEFLVKRKYAIRDTILNISLPTSEAISFELAEVNDSLFEVRPRVRNIIQLVSSFSNPFSYYPNNILRSVNHPLDELVTEQEGKRNLDKALEHRTPIHIPSSGRVMRKKVFVSNESWVQSALERPSIQSNQNNESSSLGPDLDSDYEDAQTSFCVDFWKKMQLPKRSSSPATSSEASFRTMKNANQATLSSASSDDFLSSESLKSSTESLLFKSLEESPSKGLKSSSFCQKTQEKSKVKATSTTSREASCNASPDVCQNAKKKSNKVEATLFKDVHDKLDRICNETFQTKYNIPTILQNNFKNNRSKSTESNKIDHGTMEVLAHSRQAVNPVSCLADLPFSQEVRRNMRGLNINTLLPMQQYSWPHLLNGGSLVLVNDCRTGRSWSYLPVVCSSVLGSLQNSAFSRELRLGPLTILLVDSKCRAKALASICASLMASSDPPMLKVVNTHVHSLPACQMMLLNSCGILVTTPDHLLDLMGHEIATIDPKSLEYFIIDDFDRLRQTAPQALNKVLQHLNDMPVSATMQLILVAQQWHAKEFDKLLKRMPKPLALFGNFLEAAMYGGLRLKFSLKVSSMKADLLLKFLAEQKAFKKRTLIYCTHEMELKDLLGILTTAGHECGVPSEAQSQQPHQLLAVSDELEQTAVRNIEVLIHYSLPHSWSKFAERFRVMADRIPNFFTTTTQDKEKQPLLSYLLLDKSNSQDFLRLTEFLRAHGFATDGAPWTNCQPQADDSIPYCPYLLSTGECAVECDKRHHFILADMPPPGNPLQQEGTVIRCKLYRAYDPGHMAVWPVEYQTKGSTQWLDAPHPVNKWIAAVEMSMGTKQTVHSPCRLGDVCVIHHMGHFKRVKIVDIPTKGPVTVQLMDYGTELLRVYSSHLLQCPEQKLRTLPPLAMDIRLSGVSAGQEGKWMTDTTQWIQESLSSISDRQQMQITVDFAMLNVVYAKEVTLVEECPKMRTSVYKLLLRKELVNRGFGKVDSQSDRQLRAMHDQQKRANGKVEGNNNNTKTYPSSLNIDPKVSSDIHTIIKKKEPEVVRDVAKADGVPKELHSIKENTAPSSPEAENDQPLTSSEALCNALMQEFSPKQDTHMFLESILEGFETTNHKKLAEQRELKLEAATQGASQGSSVSKSLQHSTISKGAVRPRVKWSQTFSHIELTIEQQVPEYELCLESRTLIYNVSTSSPPQHFVLPLLGEVRIVSQKQHGYYLKIKLAKVDRLMDWPTLFDSVYTQKHSRWLTYDIDRADEPSPPAGLVMWERYSRHHVNKDDYSSEDDELYSEPDVEPNESVEICE